MDGQIDPKLIRSIGVTKSLLESHISKPMLTEKYLGRPPFRFLLEIVNNVIQETRFMRDVFPSKEIKYENVSTAEDKRAILQKVIDAIEDETGEKCPARISKILSGKEPDKTNEMLQLLAKAISSFSNKQKISENDTTTVNVNSTMTPVESEERRNSAKKVDKRNATRKTDDDKNMKSKRRDRGANVEAPPHKSNGSTTTTNVKVRSSQSSSDSKLTGKPIVGRKNGSLSNCSIKTSHVNELKSKPGSPPVLKSSLQSNKTSNIILAKTISKSTLANQISATSSKTSITPETQGKGKFRSESQTKLQQISKDPKSATITAVVMPPETSAQVPLQRPVSRTKYRQKIEVDAEDAAVEDVSQPSPDNQELLSSSYCQISPTPPHSERIEENDHHVNVVVANKMDCIVGGDVRSGRSSSSEEVATDTIEQKILEWRATSAETMGMGEPAPDLCKKLHTAGWITNNSEKVVSKDATLNVLTVPSEHSIADNITLNAVKQNPGVTIPLYSNAIHEVMDKAPERPITVLADILSGNEEDDSFLVQEKIECDNDMALDRFQHSELLMSVDDGRTLRGSYLPPENRGLLVNQIIETQRELERWSSNRNHSQVQASAELETRDKAAMREVYLKQIEDLKGAIQKMSKCANPIANMIQRTQDDACLMEIEFSKLRKEDEKLQKKLIETKGQTSKILLPLTEELTQLDSRIKKVEDAIIQAKQRLSLIDTEYQDMFITQLENTPTEDEAQELQPLADPILQLLGNDEDNNPSESKTLKCVFEKVVNMHNDVASFIDKAQDKMCPHAIRNSLILNKFISRNFPGTRTRSKLNRSSLNKTESQRQNFVEIDDKLKPTWWD